MTDNHYKRHILHFFGDTKEILKFAQDIKALPTDDTLLTYDYKEKGKYSPSAHQRLRWLKDKAAILKEAREWLHRPDSYPVLDWEVLAYLSGHPYPHHNIKTPYDEYHITDETFPISLARLIMVLKPNNFDNLIEMQNDEEETLTGHPNHYQHYPHMFSNFGNRGIAYAQGHIKKITQKRSHFKIDFGTLINEYHETTRIPQYFIGHPLLKKHICVEVEQNSRLPNDSYRVFDKHSTKINTTYLFFQKEDYIIDEQENFILKKDKIRKQLLEKGLTRRDVKSLLLP
jgi:hypothetical protein